MDGYDDLPGVADLLAWLYQHQDEVVGIQASTFSCPLARWLSEVNGVPYVVVSGAYKRADVAGFLSLPSWAVQFVSEIDQLLDREVTGNEAINVLAVVLAPEADR